MGSVFSLVGVGAAAIVGVLMVLIGILAIFLFAIIGALVGAITGTILDMVPVLGPLVKQGFMAFGVANPNLPAIGAMLGFVAGFFKGSGGGNGNNSEGWKR